MSNRSWWTRCTPNTDLDAANEEIGFMREDWQKVGRAFGFEDFVDPEVIIAKAESLTNLHTQTMILKVDAASLADRLTGTEGIVLDIFAERDRQDAQWGGPEHDDGHTAHDWLRYIGHQAQRAHDETLSDDRTQLVDPEHYRQRLVKIAALAVAALESHDRSHPRPLPGEPEEEKPGPFGKAQLLAYLEDALPGGVAVRGFSLDFWALIGGTRGEDGLDALQHAARATREHEHRMGPAGRISVGMDFADASIHIEVEA